MQKLFTTVQDLQGNAVVNATLQVSSYPAGVLATIYSDAAGLSPITNPLTTDVNGYCEYYAANGHYSWTITTNESVHTINDIIQNDPGSSITPGPIYPCTVAGGTTANQLNLTSSPNLGALSVPSLFRVTATITNTAAMQCSIDGLPNVAIQLANAALTGGEFQIGKDYYLDYDGANLQLFPVGTNGITGAFVGISIPAVVSGSANALTLTPVVPLPALQKYQRLIGIATATNTGATTLTTPVAGINVTKNLYVKGAPCAGGEVPTGVTIEVMYDGVQWQLTNPTASGSGGGGTVLPGLRIGIITDSTGARNQNMPAPWAELLGPSFNMVGVPCTVYSVAGDGMTYNRALNGYASYQFGSNTALQQLNSYQCNLIFVCLGPADLLVSAEGRTLTQVKADALAFHAALRAANPTATIVYVSPVWYDATNYPTPGTTLLNQGAVPYMMALNSAGINANLWTSEILGNSVAAGTLTAYSNWLALDAYVKGFSSGQGVDTYFSMRYWDIARMGGMNSDLLHPNELGRRLLTSEIVNGCRGGYFSTLMPHLKIDNETQWETVPSMFASMFTASGAAWTENFDALSEAVRSAGNWDLRPKTWFQPYPMQVEFTQTTGSGAIDNFIFHLYKGPPFAQVNVSVDGAAFITLTGVLTDADGNAFNIESGQALLTAGYTVGTHTLRYSVATAAAVGIGGTGAGISVLPRLVSPNWTFTTPTLVSIASGGTGQSTAAAALAALGGAAAAQGSGISMASLFQNNWANTTLGVTYEPCYYYLDTINFVHWTGNCYRSSGVPAAGEAMVGAFGVGYGVGAITGFATISNKLPAGVYMDSGRTIRYLAGDYAAGAFSLACSPFFGQ